MQAYVEQKWEPAVLASPNPADKSKGKRDDRGQADRVVPFFPKDWSLQANDVFNLIMNG